MRNRLPEGREGIEPPRMGLVFSYVRKNRKARAVSQSLGAMHRAPVYTRTWGGTGPVGGMCWLGLAAGPASLNPAFGAEICSS